MLELSTRVTDETKIANETLARDNKKQDILSVVC